MVELDSSLPNVVVTNASAGDADGESREGVRKKGQSEGSEPLPSRSHMSSTQRSVGLAGRDRVAGVRAFRAL